jgi:hypothetical protein
MRPTLYPLLFALAASPLAAATKITGPHEVRAGGFAQLSIDSNKSVIWTVTPEPIQETELFGTLIFTGHAGIDYTATAVVIDFEAKRAEKVKHTVRFAGGPSPPVPPVPPDPIPPVDPLVTAIRTAAKADGWPAAKLAAYASGYRNAVGFIPTHGDEVGRMLDAATLALAKALGDGVRVPTNVRAVVGVELTTLDSIIPTSDRERALTDEDRQQVRALFSRLAAALEEAAK